MTYLPYEARYPLTNFSVTAPLNTEYGLTANPLVDIAFPRQELEHCTRS